MPDEFKKFVVISIIYRSRGNASFQNEINAENRKLLSSIINLTKTIFLCKNGGCARQD
jgi:hypothetical protein